MAVNPLAGATAESSISPGGGGQILGLDSLGGPTLGFDPGGPHCRTYLTYMFMSMIPREGPHRRIRSPGGHTRELVLLGGRGHIEGSDPPGEGHTRGSASNLNISANSNLYFQQLRV